MIIESDLKLKLKTYSLSDWKQTLSELFGSRCQFLNQPVSIQLPADFVINCQQFGIIQLEKNRRIALLDTLVKDNKQIAINRVELRNVVQRLIDQDKFHGILVVYHNDQQTTYRLSFIARTADWNEDGELVQTQTNPRRFTYVLGGNEAGTTAAKRLLSLVQKPTLELKDFIDAFAVENLNKDFFDRYNKFYKEFTEYLTKGEGKGYRHSVFQLTEVDNSEQRDRDEKPIRDFVKKLLGRIVFLHFLQKKGWMGVPTPLDDQLVVWENGRINFLQDLFNVYNDKEQFHSQCLTELFFNTLNLDKDKRTKYVFRIAGKSPFGNDVSVPYLNGGLFDNDTANTNHIDFPTDFFRRLLDFFCDYNFTIDENNPDEHEVGIDPEMLGHIFENLLEENREKGTFYTPKEVVQYMCQESLIQYLNHHLNTESQPTAQVAIDALIRQGDKGEVGAKTNFVLRNARRIEELLDAVTICDPAIGSGAFPMGMLQTIYRTKLALDWTLDPAQVKKEIIERSIYGVDIEAGAVDIARLRFWLSLVVDEEEPQPLPNLDYKIMQGDSLLESFEGIRLDTLLDGQSVAYVMDNGQLDIFGRVADSQLSFDYSIKKKEELHDLLDLYYDPDKLKQRGLSKEAVRQDIDKLVHDHIEYNFELAEISSERRIGEFNMQINDLQTSINNNPNESAQKRRQKETRIEQLKRQEERLQKDLETVRARKERLYAISSENKPYFLWHLFFQDVFKQGGFDIVIGNPPYVRQEALTTAYKDLIRENYPRTHSGTADLLVYFVEKGWQLLKPGGQFAFITSNKWIRTGYGKGMRQLLTEVQLQKLLDFGDLRVFDDATAYPCIFLFRKAIPNQTFEGLTFKYLPWKKGEDLNNHVKANHYDINLIDLDPDGWQLNDSTAQQVLDKMKVTARPLEEYLHGKAYYGIKPGAKIFIIDEDIRNRLVHEHKSSVELVKPVLLGRNLKRYATPKPENFLIFTRRGVQIDDYPGVKKYLERHIEQLRPKPKDWNDEQGKWPGRKPGSYKWYELQDAVDYYKLFEQPKIMYQTFQVAPCFIYDESGLLCNNSMWFIPTTDKYLLGFLNSQVGWYCITQFCTKIQNGYQLIFDYLRKVPVANPNEATRQAIEQLVNQILSIKQHNPVADTTTQDAQIDALLFSLYGLNETELIYVLGRNTSLSDTYKSTVQNQFRNIERGRFQIVA